MIHHVLDTEASSVLQYVIMVLTHFQFQVQSSSQQRQEMERKELEQSHAKVVQQLESRVYELEGTNKV